MLIKMENQEENGQVTSKSGGISFSIRTLEATNLKSDESEKLSCEQFSLGIRKVQFRIQSPFSAAISARDFVTFQRYLFIHLFRLQFKVI